MKMSVLNIAKKNSNHLPQYKTILGQGHGTQNQGSLARNTAISGTPGGNYVTYGSNAGSGVIMNHERSKSVGMAEKQAYAMTVNVQHRATHGHEISNRTPRLLEQSETLRKLKNKFSN